MPRGLMDRLLFLLLVTSSLAACEPVGLAVGQRRQVEPDASASDAARDATRSRSDAGDDDWDDPREGHTCREQRDCNDNFRRVWCSPFEARCVECFEDRNCFSGRCNEQEGVCRDGPRM
jgi:hypothetical protein